MSIRFERVDKSYGSVVALAGLELLVGDGELLTVVGPSGCGKTTALRLLAGLEAPTSGRVHVGGRDVTDEAPHRRDVAMVFQDLALFPHLSARENIAFGPRIRGEHRAESARRVDELGERLGLTAVLDRYPDQISGGERQRVALARAMVRSPRAYLLDEPLSDLDAQLRVQARAEILELHREIGATMIYVTHDQAEAMTLGDRVAVLADGHLQQVGPPVAVYDEPANLVVAAFLGSPPMNLVDGATRTGRLLGGSTGEVVGVRPEHLRVEDGATISATVSVVERLGSETVVWVITTDGMRLAVRTDPHRAVATGELLGLAAAPGRVHHFDAASGARR
jgi:multiple sugar transport system ATP-binding protein